MLGDAIDVVDARATGRLLATPQSAEAVPSGTALRQSIDAATWRPPLRRVLGTPFLDSH
jgi:hypothetical protein